MQSYKISYEFILACCMVVLAMLMFILKYFLTALFFTNQNSKINVIALQSLVTLLANVPMSMLFLIYYLNGFQFESIDMLYGSIIGISGTFILSLSMLVVVKGKAGAADALIETNTFICTLLDWILFSRKPTILQLFCICLASLSTLMIIIGSRSKNRT